MHASPLPNPPPQAGEGDREGRGRPQKQFKREKRDVHGWVVLDKPVGMTSTQAVGVIKRLFSAKRAGHAGTLDPLASGVCRSRSAKRPRPSPSSWTAASSIASPCAGARSAIPTTPRAGSPQRARSAPRPDAISALLPAFTGVIQQVPPRFSAIKVEGERAYDLARDGEAVELRRPPGRDRPAGAG